MKINHYILVTTLPALAAFVTAINIGKNDFIELDKGNIVNFLARLEGRMDDIPRFAQSHAIQSVAKQPDLLCNRASSDFAFV